MKRREFLRLALGAGVAAGTFLFGNPLYPRLRRAHAAPGKTVVVIFQRGGCDGLNVVVPYGDSEYYNLRPTIGIKSPFDSVDPQALDLNGFFGLHPSLAPLAEIYDDGGLAVFPTVQYENASRSHFDSQHFIESAASFDDRSRKNDLDGWLNRHMQTYDQSGGLRAVSFGSSLAQSLRGEIFVSSFSSLSGFTLGLGDADAETALLDRLGPVYGQTPSPETAYRKLVHDSGSVAIANLDVVDEIDLAALEPGDQTHDYPNTSYGRQLKDIAKLIKAGVDLELATVSIGGWDTHSTQGGAEPEGRQARRLAEFAGGIAAFNEDLKSGGPQGENLMSDVLVLTMTEFGRTSKENASFGTDHGNASAWFAVSGGANIVPGANDYIFGDWPGLAVDDLYRGRYLMHTVDYRNLFGEILTRFMGNPDLGVVFTGGSPGDDPSAYEPVGFLA